MRTHSVRLWPLLTTETRCLGRSQISLGVRWQLFALRFPDQPTAKTERIIKEKLLAGLPSAKAELGHCQGDEYPLANFLDLFENARRRTRSEQG